MEGPSKLSFDALLEDFPGPDPEESLPSSRHWLHVTPDEQAFHTELHCEALDAGEKANCHAVAGHYREGEVVCGIVDLWESIGIDALDKARAGVVAPTWRVEVEYFSQGYGEDFEAWVRPTGVSGR